MGPASFFTLCVGWEEREHLTCKLLLPYEGGPRTFGRWLPVDTPVQWEKLPSAQRLSRPMCLSVDGETFQHWNWKKKIELDRSSALLLLLNIEKLSWGCTSHFLLQQLAKGGGFRASCPCQLKYVGLSCFWLGVVRLCGREWRVRRELVNLGLVYEDGLGGIAVDDRICYEPIGH